MDAEFMLFLKSYIDGEFKELVETKKVKCLLMFQHLKSL